MPVNTAALKTFAPAMRRQLLEAVGRKLDLLLNSQTPDTLSTYAKQIAELREKEAENREQLLERVAYTWFNRLCALRYLDARGWHPFGCKVLMPTGEGETQPELLKLMRAGSLPTELKPHTNEARLHGLLDGQIPPVIAGADPQGEVYRELVLASCRSYHQLLPELFEGLDDASELLLPDDLLSEGSIAGGFRSAISDADCEDVEIIGWLYQFYISEKKDEVMARKKAVPSEDIPAVTQLFTPHWIVRYLVENSLGRLWLRSRPNSGLKQHMPYYVEDPEGQTPTDSLTVASPEEIKLLDPACGSGHMLTYAFNLLVKIWEEDGHPPSEIPDKILTHNLYGLEICPRAAQLAQFALVCKAREHSRTAFRRPVQPQVMCLQNVVISPEEIQAWMNAMGMRLSQEELTQIHQFRENTETFGSLIQPVLDREKLAILRAKMGKQAPAGDLLVQDTHLKLRLVLDQAEMLSQRYRVMVANPPYMGRGAMTETLKSLIELKYPSAEPDLYAAFLLHSEDLTLRNAYAAMITMQGWMFLAGYTGLRKAIAESRTILSLLQLGTKAFDELSGEVVQTAAFTIQNSRPDDCKSLFYDLTEGRSSSEKERQFANAGISPDSPSNLFKVRVADFLGIRLYPFVYSISERLRKSLALPPAEEHLVSEGAVKTGNNKRFIRYVWEVSASAISGGGPWRLHPKGGDNRRWFGNLDSVVLWTSAAREHYRNDRIARIPIPEIWDLKGISWSSIASGNLGFRIVEEREICNNAALFVYPKDQRLLLVMAGCLNSTVSRRILSVISPSLNALVGDVMRIPVPITFPAGINDAVISLIQVSRSDWNNFETSWDFRDLPLLRPGDWEVEPGLASGPWKGRTLAESWANYSSYCAAAIRRMQELETENNRLWIDAYGLQDELTPEVPEDEITLARADKAKEVAAFLSYAVGCMMGRYSLDQPGLILADAGVSVEHYLAKVGMPLEQVSFLPDPDGIIPVLDGEWFEDDIVARTREFLTVTFPESSVGENLRFIEESLGKDIRKYFCSEFYKDHLQTYKKRPIYWMVQSPKKGFACLIYLHRYTKDTLNQVLNNYFRPYLQKLEARLAQLGLDQLNDDLPTRERTAARKEAEKITKVLKECQAWEQDALLPLAQQRIELDLDDGVKVNYLKLQDVLAPIPELAAKED